MLAGALSGCLGDSDAPFALPRTPDVFRAARSGPSEPVGDWSRAFGSRELTRLVAQAQAQNFDIAAAAARIDEADAQARIAGSALFPQLSGAESFSRTLTPGTARSREGPFSSIISNRYSLGLNAAYTVDLFGRNRALALAAETGALASRYDRDAVSVATLASVAPHYFNLVAAQERLRVAQRNIAIASAVLEGIRARLAVGTATALDVAQQESVLANQRAAAPSLEQIVQQSRNLIIVLLGRPPEEGSVRGGPLGALRVPNVRPGLPAQLLLRRPDIAAAEARLMAQGANVRAARAAFFPTITLTGSVGFESIVLKNLLRPDAIAASLAQGLTQPIFDAGNLQGQLELAKGSQLELLETYRKTIVTALSDVENALIAVAQSAAQERLQRAALAAAQRAYDITQARLREGTIDVITLLATQTALFQAQDLTTLARQQRLQAAVTLYQALGGGWSREGEPLVFVPDASVPASLDERTATRPEAP